MKFSFHRQFLRFLPKPIGFELIRRSMKISHEWPSDLLEIKIANTHEELEAAYRLLHDAYVKAQFMNPHSTGLRILPQHLLPQTTTIVAKYAGKVVGTLSLIRDNPFGLPMEKIFDLTERRAGSRRLAEVSSLALDPKFRGNVNSVLLPLFRFVYQYARHYFGTHEFVIAVNPSMVGMYLSLMCFEKISKTEKSYEFVKGAPAVGLYLNFETCEQRWIKAFHHRPFTSNFYKYWQEIPTHPLNRLPRRDYREITDPVITPDLLERFFFDQAQLWKTLTIPEFQLLRSIYRDEKYQAIFDNLNNRYAAPTRDFQRLEVKIQVTVMERPGEIWNVSQFGFLLQTELRLEKDQVIDLKVQIKDLEWISIKAQIRWTSGNLFGVQFNNPHINWLRMIRSLEKKYADLAADTIPVPNGQIRSG